MPTPSDEWMNLFLHWVPHLHYQPCRLVGSKTVTKLCNSGTATKFDQKLILCKTFNTKCGNDLLIKAMMNTFLMSVSYKFSAQKGNTKSVERKWSKKTALHFLLHNVHIPIQEAMEFHVESCFLFRWKGRPWQECSGMFNGCNICVIAM